MRLAAAPGLEWPWPGGAASIRPNILLVVIDCARADRWLDDRHGPLTPNLRRFRRDAVTFPVCIAETSGTTPNFATLLSGLYSPRHGVRMILGNTLDRGIPLLTETLSDLGYHTYAEVTGPLVPDIGLDRGFESYEYRAPCDYLHTAWGARFAENLRTGAYRPPWFILLHLWELHLPRQAVSRGTRPRRRSSDYDTAVASLDAQLVPVLEAAGEDALVVITGDHGEKLRTESYRPGTAVEYIGSFVRAEKARGVTLNQISGWMGPSVLHHLLSEFARPILKTANLEGRRPQVSFSWIRRTGDVLRLLRLAPKVRPADVFLLNAPLKLTKWIREKGLLDKARSRDKALRFLKTQEAESLEAMFTRLLVSSMRNDLEEGHILHVYDSLVRVPLVIRWKGRFQGGRIIPGMVRQPDILPTVLELAGACPGSPSPIDGRSFMALLNGEHWKPRPAFIGTGRYIAKVEIRGVRTPSWKYTCGPFNADLPEELYDLRRDPAETSNLAPHKPGACTRMRRLLASFSFPPEAPADPAPPGEGKDGDRIARVLKGLGYLD